MSAGEHGLLAAVGEMQILCYAAFRVLGITAAQRPVPLLLSALLLERPGSSAAGRASGRTSTRAQPRRSDFRCLRVGAAASVGRRFSLRCW